MTKFFTYMLECSDGTLYTGATVDMQARLNLHNRGKGAKYTRNRLPAVLVYVSKHPTWLGALTEERAIKKLTRTAKQRKIKQAKAGRHA
jgi:putative endonuclease